MWMDARLPVRFGPLHSRTPTEAVLTDSGTPGPGAWAALAAAPTAHPAGCACCLPRSPAAVALAALFRARATGASPPFAAVLAVLEPGNQAALRAALETDPIASARFRLADGQGPSVTCQGD